MINWMNDHLPLIFGMLALPISIIALVWALNAGDTVTYEVVDGQEAASVAQQALDRSEQNNESVGTVLSLLEVGLALLGAIIAAAAVFLTINVRDIRGDLEQRAGQYEDKVDSLLSQRERELDDLSNQLRSVVASTKDQISDLSSSMEGQIDTLTSLITSELQTARQQAENSFKVLSLQLLAEQQVRARNYKTAIQTLEEAYELDEMNQTTNYLLGYLYTARRRFDDALKHLRKALEVNPDFAPVLAAMGLAQRRIGDQQNDVSTRNQHWAQAELNLLKALELDPNMVDADGESYFGTLGGLYRRQNRHEDALHAYQEAVKVTPRSSYPAGNLAVLYKYLGRDEEANEAFERVQDIALAKLDENPNDHWSRLDLAQALLVRGEVDEALKEYRQLVFREPGSGTLEIGISGLAFLARSPSHIEGIQEAIQLLKDAMHERENL
ncbi:MAG: tetratricopeptide repeat protein [Chloroflexi bacterium]|nr:tetratricopeptide repeat protein [Chloroflexota bacterium]